MSKHTSGSWKAVSSGTAHNEDKHTIQASDGTWIAETIPHQPRGCSQEANARLIAAAPDLLAALQGAIDRLDAFLYRAEDSASPEVEVARDEMRSAIAKAEGK